MVTNKPGLRLATRFPHPFISTLAAISSSPITPTITSLRAPLLPIVVVFVNLINYMDRSTVAGMMDSIRKDAAFNIQSDKSLGLLQG